MKITAISYWRLDLLLSRPYRLSGGRLLFERLDSTILRLETDAGLSGWGEACPWGETYLPAHGPGVRAALQTLAPSVLGQDPRSPEALCRTMDAALPGHLYAKSAVDVAAWDILGQFAGLPLWRLFGGVSPEPVALNSSIATGPADEMIERIAEARAHGYRTHSAKLGGADASLDLARIEAIDAALRPGESVTYDVNRAWTPATALQVLNATASRAWIEQPCETLDECRQVAAKVAQPVLLDECLHTYADHLAAWRTDACLGAKVKPNRVGGLTKAKKIIDFAMSVGWRLHIEDVGGTALADTAAIHLASATPEPFRMASWLAHAHLADDPMDGQGARNNSGFAAPPDAPGLGVRPDQARLGPPAGEFRL